MESKIIHGECFEELRNIPDASIDLVLTDPPYSTPVVVAFGRKKVKKLSDLSIQEFYVAGLRDEFERILKPNGRVVIFCDDKYYPVLFASFYEWHNVNLLIWDKGRIGMGKPFRKQHELMIYAAKETYEPTGTLPTVIKCSPVGSNVKQHGAEKPVELLKKLIEQLTAVGDTVLDPFSGSGSTLLAAKELGRNYIGIEMDADYFKIAQARISSVPSLTED